MKKFITKILMVATLLLAITTGYSQTGVQITINDSPTLYSVTGGGTYCAGLSGVPVGLSGSETNTTYQVQVGGIDYGMPITGTGLPLNFGNQLLPGVYTVIATSLTTGCSIPMSNSINITVNPIPAIALTASGPVEFCGSGTVTLTANAGSGVTYYWQHNGVNIPGANLNQYVANATGMYTVVATSTSTGCSNDNDTMVQVHPLPQVFTVSSSDSSFCEGSTGVTINLNGSQTGINYQLLLDGLPVGSIVAGTGLALDWTNQDDAGTYSIVAEDNLTGCTSTMSAAPTVAMNPLPDDAVSITGPTSVCQGSSASFSTSPILNASSYTWSVPMGATITSGGGSTMITVMFSGSASGDISVYGQNTCGGGQPYIFPVTVNTAPSLATSASPATICAGNSTTLSASGSGVSYIWTGGSTGSSVNMTPSTTTTYYVTATGSNGCTSTDDVVVTVNPLPNVTLALSPSSACQGVYSVTLSGGSPAGGSYIGGCVSGTNTVYPGSLPVNTWGIYYEYTDPGTGCSNTSPTYNFTINPEPWVDFDPFYPGAVIPLDEPPFIVTTGAPYGGTYSGPGFYQVGTNWWFSAADAGTGTHTATYSYTALSTGCDGEEYRTYTVGAVGIDEVTAAVNAVSIFPNPVSGSYLNLHGIDTKEISSLKVMDVMGRILFENSILSENMQLDVAEFAPGTYIIFFTDADGVSVSKRFVKGN